MLSTTIPFEGFYESRLGSYIDGCIAREAENASESESGNEGRFQNIPENQQLSENEHAALIHEAARYGHMHSALAVEYAAQFFHMLKREAESLTRAELHIEYEFEELVSPHEYNFETDSIYVKIDEQTAAELLKLVPVGFLVAKIEERHTSRSGFISFISNDLETWDSYSKWSAHQLGTLMEAAIEYVAGDTWEEDLDGSMQGCVDAIFEENVDWPKYERLVREDRIRKAFDADPVERCAHTKDMFKE